MYTHIFYIDILYIWIKGQARLAWAGLSKLGPALASGLSTRVKNGFEFPSRHRAGLTGLLSYML